MVENNSGNAPETCKAKWSELLAGISAHPSLPHKLVQNNGGDSGPNGAQNGGPNDPELKHECKTSFVSVLDGDYSLDKGIGEKVIGLL